MWSSLNILERAPMVWFLLGLLFNAGGLYLGFDVRMSLVYMMIGWFCCAYGVALFLFRLRESPKNAAKTRLSPNFVSLNATDEPLLNPARNASDEKPEPPEAQAAEE